MQINRFQMREMAVLAQEAGPHALKGLSEVERRVLKIMMEALQKKDHSPITIKGLDKHKFNEMKDYLKRAIEEKQAGRIFAIPPDRMSRKESFKGIKNLLQTRLGTSTLEKEIDRALAPIQRGRKSSNIQIKSADPKLQIQEANKKMDAIKQKAYFADRAHLLEFLIALEKKPESQFSALNNEVVYLVKQMRQILEDEALPNGIKQDLAAMLSLAYFTDDFLKTVPDAAFKLKPYPHLAARFDLLHSQASLVHQLIREGTSDRQRKIKETIAELKAFFKKTDQVMAEQQALIDSSLQSMERPIKKETEDKKLTARERKLEALDTQIKQLQGHVEFLAVEGQKHRQDVREKLREELLAIRKNPDAELKVKNLVPRLRKTFLEIRTLGRIKNDPKSAIRREELILHLRNLVKIRRTKSRDAKLDTITNLLNAPIKRGTKPPMTSVDKLMKEYIKVTETLQKRRAKLETR